MSETTDIATPRQRNLGTCKQAAEIVDVAPSTIRSWHKQRLISAVRVGRRFRYDLDDVAALRVEYPRNDLDERIRELVDAAPELSEKQITTLRLLLHATGGADQNGGDAA